MKMVNQRKEPNRQELELPIYKFSKITSIVDFKIVRKFNPKDKPNDTDIFSLKTYSPKSICFNMQKHKLIFSPIVYP